MNAWKLVLRIAVLVLLAITLGFGLTGCQSSGSSGSDGHAGHSH